MSDTFVPKLTDMTWTIFRDNPNNKLHVLSKFKTMLTSHVLVHVLVYFGFGQKPFHKSDNMAVFMNVNICAYFEESTDSRTSCVEGALALTFVK